MAWTRTRRASSSLVGSSGHGAAAASGLRPNPLDPGDRPPNRPHGRMARRPKTVPQRLASAASLRLPRRAARRRRPIAFGALLRPRPAPPALHRLIPRARRRRRRHIKPAFAPALRGHGARWAARLAPAWRRPFHRRRARAQPSSLVGANQPRPNPLRMENHRQDGAASFGPSRPFGANPRPNPAWGFEPLQARGLPRKRRQHRKAPTWRQRRRRLPRPTQTSPLNPS